METLVGIPGTFVRQILEVEFGSFSKSDNPMSQYEPRHVLYVAEMTSYKDGTLSQIKLRSVPRSKLHGQGQGQGQNQSKRSSQDFKVEGKVRLLQ